MPGLGAAAGRPGICCALPQLPFFSLRRKETSAPVLKVRVSSAVTHSAPGAHATASTLEALPDGDVPASDVPGSSRAGSQTPRTGALAAEAACAARAALAAEAAFAARTGAPPTPTTRPAVTRPTTNAERRLISPLEALTESEFNYF